MEQMVLTENNNYDAVDSFFIGAGVKKILLVCGNSVIHTDIGYYFKSLEERTGVGVVIFSDFVSNPQYSSIVEGVGIFRRENCDMIVAVGGGSAIDVAKCIKLYSTMDSSQIYLTQKIIPNNIKLLVAPTTAGTGSEANRFAVIYYHGEKQSIFDESCLPSIVLMAPSALKTLPEYHRKATMMDAFCHAIESFWAVSSTEESQKYASDAIRLILEYKDLYLNNKTVGNRKMLYAAYLAGKAINITQTTAGHALCYKLTGLYGIAHGHAAALCVAKLFPYMVSHINKCIDVRGEEYVWSTFYRLATIMGYSKIGEAILVFENLLSDLGLGAPSVKNNEELNVLQKSVNATRLKNNPIRLDIDDLHNIYRKILM